MRTLGLQQFPSEFGGRRGAERFEVGQGFMQERSAIAGTALIPPEQGEFAECSAQFKAAVEGTQQRLGLGQERFSLLRLGARTPRCAHGAGGTPPPSPARVPPPPAPPPRPAGGAGGRRTPARQTPAGKGPARRFRDVR